jgi:tetratricopeptide (TPR) repeat protein
MRRLSFILTIWLVAGVASIPAWSTDAVMAETQIISCGNGVPGGVDCIPSKKELQQAHKDYARGLKLQGHQQLQGAFDQFDEGSRLAPHDTKIVSARELAKSQLVFQHTERGDDLMANAQPGQALSEFRAALELDPENQYAKERLADAMRDAAAPAVTNLAALLADSAEIHLLPKGERATFHYRGDVRGLFASM